MTPSQEKLSPGADAPLAPGPRGKEPTAVSIRGIHHAFDSPDGGSRAPVLVDIDLEIAEGEFVAIVGPSGCGKTTLMNLVAGLEEVQQGEITVASRRPKAGDRNVGYLFARDALLPWRTVRGNAELALEIAGVPRSDRADRAAELLGHVGLLEHLDAYPAQLSQGMRQRVAIARTLAARPRLLMLDEPFSALDAQTKLVLQETFTEVWGQQRSTVVLITHDLSEAVALADRVVVMTARPGKVKRIYPVDLPRPRSIMNLQGDPRFHAIYEQLWAELRDEVIR